MEPQTCVETGLVLKLILDVCVTQVRVLVLSLRSDVHCLLLSFVQIISTQNKTELIELIGSEAEDELTNQ